MRIAVIAGAGPAGLTAAYELLKRTDVVPLVVEQTGAIGGIAQTYNYKGNRIDIGGHRFFSKSERVMNWWFNILPLQGSPSADTEEHGHEIDYATEAVVEFLCRQCVNVPALPGETRVRRRAPDPEREDEVMLQRPRLSRIYYRRSFFPYPIAITLSVAARLGWWNTFRIGLSYVRSQLFPRKDETYLDAFFVNRFGRRLYETFFRDYTEKVWGVKCGEIRADWGAQRVKGLSLKRAVAHAVRDLLSSDFKKAQEERETSLITRFFYPKYGPGQMWETVARHVQKCGGEVRMRTRVVGVELSGSRVGAVTLESLDTGAREVVSCAYFFSTMPIRELAAITKPAPPAGVSEVAAGLQYRDFLTVGLLLRKLHVQEKGKTPAGRVADNWIYVQDGGVRVGRVQVFNNWSPYMVADHKNTVWIGLEYFVDEGDDLWQMRDRDLVTFGTREMELIGFLRGEDVLDGCVLRMPKAYPAYFGSYERLAEVQAWANTVENLFLVGRNGMHRYNNQDHSMLTAMLAVDNIVEGRVDKTNLWDVNLEMVYH
ncbi:MAG: NAD(P)/FAD-dependent oxidoreductase, partial [Gemmatimonadota bacterium]|nr:NAD(P)/FAD-dependent oxidoreductase [Gemmatimonadota bacterium]